MKKTDLAYFKKLLLSKRAEIMREMGLIQDISINDTSKDATGTDSTYSTHMADQGTDASEREKAFFYVARDNKYLQYINQALERIENGTFGICSECGRDIPRERLEAVPITQKCLDCKMQEKQ